MSTEWNNNNQNSLNGLLWRPGTSMLADTASERIPAARRAYTPPLACNYLTYMQATDGTEATAPLRVVPGSHRDYSTVPEDLADPSARWSEREHLVSAPAGSVVFTHCGILHSGSHNSRPETRYFVSCYINRLGLPVRDVQQGALVEAKLAQARARRDLRIIRLLGQEEEWMEKEEAMWARQLEVERAARL